MAIDKRIFPTSGRTSGDISIDLGTNLVTEYNLASIINQLVDEDGFVISYGNNIIEFNIAGYYFQVDLTGINQTVLGDYVKINVTGDEYVAEISLKNYNQQKSFCSLISCTSADWDNGTKFTLTLLKNGEIPRDSRIHFKTYIDDGSLD